MEPGRITSTITELPESRIRVQIEVAAKEFQVAVERAAGQLGRNLRVPGFRKGKVPAPVVIRKLGRTKVLDRAMRDGVSRWYLQALREAQVAYVGSPALELGQPPADGEPLRFSLDIGVCPVATLGRYTGLEVGRCEPQIDDDAVEAELQVLRWRHARLEVASRPAVSGDVLLIDFQGEVDGEPFEGGRGRDQMVELGSGMLIGSIEEELVGASAGEQRTIEVDFPDVESPEDHRAETVAGGHAVFTVKVKEVRAKKLPEIDDELAGAEGFETLAELRDDLAAALLRADARRIAEDFKAAALDAAVAEAVIEVPDALVRARAREICDRRLRRLHYEGVTKEVYLQISGKTEAELVADAHPEADRELRRAAVVIAVVAAEGIDVSGDPELATVDGPPAEDVDEATLPLEARLGAPDTPDAVLARRRALTLMADQAVPITVEEAKAQGRPHTAARASEDPAPGLDVPEIGVQAPGTIL